MKHQGSMLISWAPEMPPTRRWKISCGWGRWDLYVEEVQFQIQVNSDKDGFFRADGSLYVSKSGVAYIGQRESE